MVAVKRTIYRLEVADGDHEGVIVRVKGRTLRERLLTGAYDLSWESDESLSTEEREKRYVEMAEAFCADVIDWNLENEDTGEPIPVTVEAVLEQDSEFMMPIIVAWVFRRVGRDDPLPKGDSVNGSLYPEVSMPMETSSENLAS